MPAAAAREKVIQGVTANEVWSIMRNVEAYPDVFPAGQFVTNLTPHKSLNPVEPGARFATQYILHGQKLNLVVSITNVEQQKHNKRRTLAFGIHKLWHCTSTYRYSVEPLNTTTSNGNNNSSCLVRCSFALIPNNWLGKWWYTKVLRRTIVANAAKWIESDVHDIEHYALAQKKEQAAAASIASSGRSIIDDDTAIELSAVTLHTYCT